MNERVQGRYVKTPSYIWKMEAGRVKLGVNNLLRTRKYILEISRMDEDRWPRICVGEEVSLNGTRAFRVVGRGLKGLGTIKDM